MGPRRARINYLVRSIQGFVEAPALAADFARDLWSSRSAIFVKPETSDCSTRLRSLYEGHRKIKRAREQHSYAARFCYIYLEHDLEALSQSQFLVLSQGRGKMTAAFELQAQIISTTVDVVKSERKAGRGYLQLLMEGGPGFILRLGRNVSTLWERKLSSSDISLIIEFLKIETPDLFDEIKSYDESAARALLDGFIAYGWTSEEIMSSRSSLFHKLREYVNLEDLLHDSTSGALPALTQPTSTSTSSRFLQHPESNSTSSDDNEEMSNAGMSLEPLSLADHLGLLEYPLSGPETIGDLWEMSAMELESILAQTEELVDAQNSMDLPTWNDCFTEGIGSF
ncbi:hypothetical protein PtrSN002B_000534 [Pyrenophora tritici-repentis]|nr:hypothetical protein PtrV1_10981 [Pyrenophora tritici-repentis]KAF7443835.1 hypothetical protein A1F99_119090 [Pyrenophora tritici-repentis]KAF7566438.1 hypothetical protein PtrM4_147580 [Pyrenophora tritici-repentis]KAI0569752.1 hypothetical protein Alg130_11517 [Pyrenophora tritici-repentis]KAI0581492.1 hypothetical protein Alg215_04681 [Pyrenophora tritici-repentis]